MKELEGPPDSETGVLIEIVEAFSVAVAPVDDGSSKEGDKSSKPDLSPQTVEEEKPSSSQVPSETPPKP